MNVQGLVVFDNLAGENQAELCDGRIAKLFGDLLLELKKGKKYKTNTSNGTIDPID